MFKAITFHFSTRTPNISCHHSNPLRVLHCFCTQHNHQQQQSQAEHHPNHLQPHHRVPKVLNRSSNVKQQQQPVRQLVRAASTDASNVFKNVTGSEGIMAASAASSEKLKHRLVSVDESRRFMIDCFTAVGVPLAHAEAMADLLVAADHRGHQSHGMNRLEMYINDLTGKVCDGAAVPKILKETPATAWVDGCNGLGAVVGNFCMDLAIQKAKNVGVGWVCAKNSNHYGMAGWYSMRAMDQGLLGMSMTNTSPLMAPTRSKTAALGTNPIAVGINGAKNEKFLLDMATTAVSVGKIEIQRRKGEPIPEYWAQDPDGNVTTDAELAFKTACLMPLGGPEIDSGYKGYGLGAMVDILSGVMGGANYSTKVRNWSHANSKSPANLGQVFIAVDPGCFSPDFGERLADFNSRLRDCIPADETKPVLIPGEKEEHTLEAIDKAGGIYYLENQIHTCTKLAERLKITPLKFL